MKNASFTMPELLYFGRGKTPSGHLHKHVFYQIEYCLSGNLFCRTRNERFMLGPGELWLIPPDQAHQFLDNRKPYEYLSLKFRADRMLPQIRRKDSVTEYYLNAILGIIDSKKGFSPFTPDGKSMIENHLCGLLHHLAKNPDSERKESRFLMEIREKVCQRGYSVNVEQLAELFHCTRSQFKYKFIKESHGSGNIKHFIEDILLELADKHLKYSSLSLSQVAEEMHFPSIYVFSRFFKRKTGITLSGYRSKNR